MLNKERAMATNDRTSCLSMSWVVDSGRNAHCSTCWIGRWCSEPGSIRRRVADAREGRSISARRRIGGHFRTWRRVRGHFGKRISWRRRGRIRKGLINTSEVLSGRAGGLAVRCRTHARTLIVLDDRCGCHHQLYLFGRWCVCDGANNHYRRALCEAPIVSISERLITADQHQADHAHYKKKPAPGPVRCGLRRVLRLRTAILLGWQSAAVVLFRVQRVGTTEVRIHIHLKHSAKLLN